MFYQVLPGFYWVLLVFTGFYRVLPGFTGFYRVSTRFHQVPLGSTRFHQVPPGSTRFHKVPLGFPGCCSGWKWVSHRRPRKHRYLVVFFPSSWRNKKFEKKILSARSSAAGRGWKRKGGGCFGTEHTERTFWPVTAVSLWKWMKKKKKKEQKNPTKKNRLLWNAESWSSLTPKLDQTKNGAIWFHWKNIEMRHNTREKWNSNVMR